jgi:hypothetical protein
VAAAVALSGHRVHHSINRHLRRSNDAKDDLKAQLDKMTIDDILPPTRDRLCADDDVLALIDYFKSDEFQQHEADLLALDEVSDLIKLLTESGADLQKFLDFVNTLLSCDSFKAHILRRLHNDQDDLAAILAEMTLEDIVPIYHDRLLKEEDVKKVLDVLTSDQGKKDLDGVLASDVWKKVEKEMDDLNIKRDRVLGLIKTLLGLDTKKTIRFTRTFGKRHFIRRVKADTCDADKLATILADLTLDDILAPTRDRLCADENISKMIAYTQTDKAQQHLNELLSLDVVNDLISKVLASGIDIQKLIDLFQQLLSCPSSRMLRMLHKATPDDLAACLADLTIEEMCPPYGDRLQKEDAIKQGIDLLNGDCHDDLEAIIASDPVQAMRADLKDEDVDADKILRDLAKCVGLNI